MAYGTAVESAVVLRTKLRRGDRHPLRLRLLSRALAHWSQGLVRFMQSGLPAAFPGLTEYGVSPFSARARRAGLRWCPRLRVLFTQNGEEDFVVPVTALAQFIAKD